MPTTIWTKIKKSFRTLDQNWETKPFCEDCVCWRIPQASGCVLEDGGPLGVPGLRVLVGLGLPARVRDDHLVGHGLQRVVYDHHLQRLVRWQIPQRSCQKTWEKKKKLERHVDGTWKANRSNRNEVLWKSRPRCKVPDTLRSLDEERARHWLRCGTSLGSTRHSAALASSDQSESLSHIISREIQTRRACVSRQRTDKTFGPEFRLARHVSGLLPKPKGVTNNSGNSGNNGSGSNTVVNTALPPWSSWIHTLGNGFKSKNNAPPRSPCGASQPFYLEIKATSDHHMCTPPFTNAVPPGTALAWCKTHHVADVTGGGGERLWVKWLNFGFLKAFWSWRLDWKRIYLKYV